MNCLVPYFLDLACRSRTALEDCKQLIKIAGSYLSRSWVDSFWNWALVLASSINYMYLRQCYLYLNCWVLWILLFHFLFSHVDLERCPGANQRDTYPYRAYLTILLSYRHEAQESWLAHLKGWAADKYDIWDNEGLAQPWAMNANARAFDLKGCLHSDKLLQERLVSNSGDVRLVLSWTRPGLQLMDFGTKPKCPVCIQESVLGEHKVKVDHPLGAAAPREGTGGVRGQVSAGPCGLPPLHPGRRHQHSGRGCPTENLIGLVINNAFFRTWQKNPLSFAHMDLNSPCVEATGSAPAAGL